jgi:hypothetical protein
MNIRKAALITFVATVLGLLMPLWNAAQTVVGIAATHPLWKWWIIPAMMLVVLFSAIMPAFYFALYRNEEPLRFPKDLRPLSLAAALMLAIVMVVGFPQWVGVFGSGESKSVLTDALEAWNMSQIATLLSGCSNLAYMLLLVTFFRHSNDASSAVPSKSALLRLTTKVAVIVWGIWLVGNLIHLLILTPLYIFPDSGLCFADWAKATRVERHDGTVASYAGRAGMPVHSALYRLQERAEARRCGFTKLGWHVAGPVIETV